MKKILTFVLIALLSMSFIFAEAQVEQPSIVEESEETSLSEMQFQRPEKIIVYVQAPEDWNFPCLWAWSKDGQNAFENWPGNQMIKDDNNPGWYYIYVPGFVDSVIVNANDGSIQTSDYAVEGKNAWITISSPETVKVSFDSLTGSTLPEYSEMYTVYTNVDSSWENPSIWAWEDETGKNAFKTWPGRKMKPNENGFYSMDIPVWCDSIIINANEGMVKTVDIKDIDPSSVWLIVAQDATFEVSYDDPNAVIVPDIKVYAKVPSTWDSPCLWAWSHPDGTNAFVNWPGQALEKNEDNWYVSDAPGWINSVIINGNEGSIQTSDIRIDSGKDVYITVNNPDSFEISYK